jgi:hypothetical protein
VEALTGKAFTFSRPPRKPEPLVPLRPFLKADRLVIEGVCLLKPDEPFLFGKMRYLRIIFLLQEAP